MNDRKSKSLIIAYKETDNIAEKLNLPTTVVNRAKGLIKRIKEGGHLPGHHNTTISSACLYISCWQKGEEGAPRTLKEILAVSHHVSQKEMSNCVKLIVDKLNTPLDKISASDFIPRFCSSLGLPAHVQEAADHIARKAVELGIVSAGRTPTAVAAAAIYMASLASGETKPQREFVKVTGVSDTTIRTMYKLIYPRAKEVFPDDFRFSSLIDRWPQI